MTKILSRAFALWLPLLAVLTGVMLFSYWATQQAYRQSANDPQIQMAEDGAAALANGAVPAALVNRNAPLTDLTQSLAPWLAVFDASGTPLESSASLGSAPLALPSGVFDQSTWKTRYAEEGIALTIPPNETRFSWQPSRATRQAVVVVRAKNGDFVAAGRSLREVENREATITHGAALAWGGTALGTFILVVLLLALGWL